MTKTFKTLKGPFQHGVAKIATAFESVAAICQHQIEADRPLCDILVEDVVFGRED